MYTNASVLSPYLCFISIIYLDFNVLGYDTSISYGAFMDPNIYLSSSTSEIRMGLVSSNIFKPSITFLLTAPRRSFYVDHYCFFAFCVCLSNCFVCFMPPCGHLLLKG